METTTRPARRRFRVTLADPPLPHIHDLADVVEWVRLAERVVETCGPSARSSYFPSGLALDGPWHRIVSGHHEVDDLAARSAVDDLVALADRLRRRAD